MRKVLFMLKTNVALITLLASFFAHATPLIMPNQPALFLSNIETVNRKAAEKNATNPAQNLNESNEDEEEDDQDDDELDMQREDEADREDED